MPWDCNTRHRTQCWTQNTEHRLQDTEYSAGHGTHNKEYTTQNTVLVPECTAASTEQPCGATCVLCADFYTTCNYKYTYVYIKYKYT